MSAERGISESTRARCLVRPIDPGMPEAFKRRRTVRLSFDSAALASVPEGLYDLRFEVHQNGALVRDDAGHGVQEFEYNAVRVFNAGPENGGRYSVINLSDTQVAVGNMFESKTLSKLKNFVSFISTTNDKRIRRAAFIAFNGDLHNSGSPSTLSSPQSPDTYRTEARAIIDQLKQLPLPIFSPRAITTATSRRAKCPELISLRRKR